ncbi:RNA polymerase sigma factor SigZ [Photobacterium nomapromontoriensis]|uniref:RNA polymerase sigma factor SigZ n=1 Tax=Photobacterium nomapromontoriensis TaxID=2910237 RepID=UPI003D14FE05
MDLDQIWNEYRGSIKGFLHKHVSNPDDVDDLKQEILIKTYQNLHTLQDATKIKPWLFQIANHVIIDFYRRRAKQTGWREEDLWYSEEPSTMRAELAHCVLPFIQALPADEAEMLRAIELNGESQKEFAQKKGLKYSTLKSRVKKSRQHVLELFQECCDLSLDKYGNVIDFEAKKKGCGCE